jgi:GT2 family glycosyltransferase
MSGDPGPSARRVLDAYPAWVRTHDTWGAADRAAAAADAAALLYRPLICVIIIGADADAVAQSVAALRGQIYPRFQAIVAGPIGGLPDDPRIEATAYGQGFAADCETALDSAVGPVIAILRAGDRLAPSALYEVAVQLGRRPDTDVLYTDEDEIDADGERAAPRFKTGWDPDLLLDFDAIGGLALYRRDLLDRIGPPAGAHPAAVLYDLALRATDAAAPDRIAHLPRVLLHRPAGSFLADQAAPVRAEMRAAVARFLGPAAEVAEAPHGHRITWPIPSPAPLVSVIVPIRDKPALLARCADGVLHRTDYPDLELLVVDNDSAEPATHATLVALLADPRVRVLHHAGAFNYAAINNRAVGLARGEVVVLLNNDTDVTDPFWLREMVGHALRPEVGAVGAKLRYEDGTVQHGGVVLAPGAHAAHMMRCAAGDDPGYLGQAAVVRSFLAVTAACLAIRRAVFLEVGGFDAEHLAVAFNDVDLCLRLRELGYRTIWTPHADLLHLESQSRGMPTSEAARAREQREVDYLRRSWRHLFDHDPYLNANMICLWDTPLQLCPPRRPKPWLRASRGLGHAA